MRLMCHTSGTRRIAASRSVVVKGSNGRPSSFLLGRLSLLAVRDLSRLAEIARERDEVAKIHVSIGIEISL